eukprot:3174957-Pyramimonas_sp.AAC.1
MTLEARTQKFKEMGSYVKQYTKQWFGRDKKVKCLLHPVGDGCPMAWADDQEGPDEDKVRPVTAAFAGFLCAPFAPCGLRTKEGHDATESYH